MKLVIDQPQIRTNLTHIEVSKRGLIDISIDCDWGGLATQMGYIDFIYSSRQIKLPKNISDSNSNTSDRTMLIIMKILIMIIDTALIHTNLNVSTLTGRFQYTHDMLFYHCYEISIYKKNRSTAPLAEFALPIFDTLCRILNSWWPNFTNAINFTP